VSLFDLLDAAFPASCAEDRAAIRLLFDEVSTIARRAAGRELRDSDDHAVRDIASYVVLKLRSHRRSRIAEFEGAPNRDARLAGWCRKVATNRAIDLGRRAKKERRALLDPIHDPEVANALGRAQLGQAQAEPEPTVTDPKVVQVLQALDALASRCAESAPARYRAGFELDYRDSKRVAFEDLRIKDLTAERGRDPERKTDYDATAKALFRARARLALFADSELESGALDQEQHRVLHRVIHVFLGRRPSGDA
jgi:DNA-directed RNA polymerase specialized sigma24 family protein